MVVVRFLFALLVGFLLGAGTTVWLINSGAGDFVIRSTEVAQDLERRLREVELQRDQLGRQLEDVAAKASRMEKAFEALEDRIRELQREHDGDRRPAPAPPPPAAQ